MRRLSHLSLCAPLALAVAATTPAVMAQTVGSTLNIGTVYTSPLYVPSGDYARSVQTQASIPGVLPLTFDQAITLAQKNNLTTLLQAQRVRSAGGQTAIDRSALLPNVSAASTESVIQDNLVPRGLSAPGVRNDIVGPFDAFDIRAYVTQNAFDWRSIQTWLSSKTRQRAEELILTDVRNLIVQAAALAYLQVSSEQSRVDVSEAQVKTAERSASDAHTRRSIGVSPAIDSTRADVTLASQREGLLAARNRLAQARITLARVIGLPLVQDYSISTRIDWKDKGAPELDPVLQIALKQRPDYQAAKAQLLAAERSTRAAKAGYFPSLSVNGNYGDFGKTPGASHGTFLAEATLSVPIYLGGRTQGEVAQAKSAEVQRRSELDNLKAEIDEQLRRDLLNLSTNREQVLVAKDQVRLADETLQQATERFNEGITNNIEVIQAQESQAIANENYIASVYAYQTAAINLARDSGDAQAIIQQTIF